MPTQGDNARTVDIYTSPWVSGTRASAYYGPITVDHFVPEKGDWDKATEDLLDLLIEKARDLDEHVNAVVGVDVSADPFSEQEGIKGVQFSATGTAAWLEPIF